ncbi:unnamed protein product [Effrenium voratum]|nr:unnamed protein product [Effrenium voratum]
MGNETMSQEDIDNTHAIVHSGKVEIYSINDRLEDVILAAVLGGGRPVTSPQSKSTKSVGVWQQLALAVQWGCTDYYDGLGRRLIQERGHAEAIRLIFQELVAFGAQDNVRSRGREATIPPPSCEDADQYRSERPRKCRAVGGLAAAALPEADGPV